MDISVWQAALIAFFYYLANSTWFAGVGFFTIYRPLVAGAIVGIILGDIPTGVTMGATINMIYLGFISAGGALPGDPALAGYLATALAISSGIDAQAALALAVPIGLLGTLIWFGRLTVNAFFVHMGDKYAEEGNMAGLMFANLVPPQLFLFIISFIPVFVAALYGPEAVKGAMDFLGQNVLGVLIVIGGMLPALGIALNLRGIAKGATMPYFFLGFFFAVYFHVSVIGIGILGVILAFLHLHFTSSGGVEHGRTA